MDRGPAEALLAALKAACDTGTYTGTVVSEVQAAIPSDAEVGVPYAAIAGCEMDVGEAPDTWDAEATIVVLTKVGDQRGTPAQLVARSLQGRQECGAVMRAVEKAIDTLADQVSDGVTYSFQNAALVMKGSGGTIGVSGWAVERSESLWAGTLTIPVWVSRSEQ